MKPTVEQLLKRFTLDAGKGELRYRKQVGRGRVGALAGSVDKTRGYVSVVVDGKRYYVHSIVYFIVYGVWPREIDHINRDKSDNRIANLESVDHSTNIRRWQPVAGSGFRGVYKHRGYFMARICAKGKKIYLGNFKTAEAALAAYEDARGIYCGT